MSNYRILREDNIVDLSKSVRELMKLGWVPQGGVTCAVSTHYLIWAQAMVKGD